ncbi:MAG TPA: ABC transporter substrate-binding protein [Gaiellaceae bacterium]
MRSKAGWIRLLSVLALAAGLALLTAAYGASANRPQSSTAHTKSLGTFRAVIDTIDYLDTSQAYTAQSLWALWTVYETLVTYRHVAGPAGYRVVPGLASLPKISGNGRVYTLTLRKGLRYSNGRAVRAADFKCTMKRDFITASPGVGFYDSIVGAKAFEANPTPGGDIPGIKIRGRTIRITLVAPRGDFLTILAEPFAALLPCGTANQDLSASPPPATGPYMIAPGADKNRGFTLVRNRFFKPTKYIPRGNANRVVVTIVGDATAAVQRVLNGQADYTNAAIPPERLGSVALRGQLRLRKSANTYYFWMNTRVYPFNKLKVRQAVNMAIDRGALVKAVWGGLGVPTQNVLPPTYPSYRPLTLYKHDVAKARQLVRQAGAAGAAVTVWGRQVSDSEQSTTLYASYLNAIGLKTTLKFLPRSTYYTVIGNINTRAQTGWARWLEDYPHPLDWFDVLLNGDNIVQENNNNFAYYSNPTTNRLIDGLKKAPALTPAVNNRWAAVEKLIMQQAPWAPWSNRVFPEFFSDKIGCISIQRLYGVDFMRLCRR